MALVCNILQEVGVIEPLSSFVIWILHVATHG